MMKVLVFNIPVLILFWLNIPGNVYSQGRMTKIIDNIDNNKLTFEVGKVGTARFIDSNKMSLPKVRVFVTSIDVAFLSAKQKKMLMHKLIPLLKDERKDWYANLLLYQLAERDATSFLIKERREDWRKQLDVDYWNNHLESDLDR